MVSLRAIIIYFEGPGDADISSQSETIAGGTYKEISVQPDQDSTTVHAVRALGSAAKLALTTNCDAVLSTVPGRTMTSPAGILQRWDNAMAYMAASEAQGLLQGIRRSSDAWERMPKALSCC